MKLKLRVGVLEDRTTEGETLMFVAVCLDHFVVAHGHTAKEAKAGIVPAIEERGGLDKPEPAPPIFEKECYEIFTVEVEA